MVEALVAGPVVVERYDAAIQSFVPYFQDGREGRPPEVLSRLSPTTEEALVGGMVSLISRRIIAGKAEELEELLPDLVEFTLTPYLGSAEAARSCAQGGLSELGGVQPGLVLAEVVEHGEVGEVGKQALDRRRAAGADLERDRFLDRADDEAGR